MKKILEQKTLCGLWIAPKQSFFMHTFCVPTYAGKVPTSVKRNFLQGRQNIIKLGKGQVIIGSFHCALIESHTWDCIPLFYMQTYLKVTFHVRSICVE